MHGNCQCLRATRRLQRGGVMLLVEDGCLSHTAKRMYFSVFSIVSMIIELTLGHFRNSKKVTCNRPGFSSRKSDVQVL